MTRRLIILTEGHTNPIIAKTAACVIRYRPDEVLALLDRSQQGRTSGELLGVGRVPVIAALGNAPSRQYAADRDRQPRRQDPAAVAEHHSGGDPARAGRDLRAARLPVRRSGVRPGRRGLRRAAGRRPQEPLPQRGPRGGAPRGVPAGADRGPRLQLRQDGRGRRGDERPASPRLRRQVRRHRPDGDHRRGRRIPDRLHGGRLRQRGRRAIGAGPSAPCDPADRRPRQPGPPVLLRRHAVPAARLPAARPDPVLRGRPPHGA